MLDTHYLKSTCKGKKQRRVFSTYPGILNFKVLNKDILSTRGFLYAAKHESSILYGISHSGLHIESPPLTGGPHWLAWEDKSNKSVDRSCFWGNLIMSATLTEHRTLSVKVGFKIIFKRIWWCHGGGNKSEICTPNIYRFDSFTKIASRALVLLLLLDKKRLLQITQPTQEWVTENICSQPFFFPFYFILF